MATQGTFGRGAESLSAVEKRSTFLYNSDGYSLFARSANSKIFGPWLIRSFKLVINKAFCRLLAHLTLH
jgi:hypothetical protein